MNRNQVFVIAAVALGLTGQALAQTATPVRIRGTIDKIDGDAVSVTTRDRQAVTFKLLPDTRVSSGVKVPLAGIKADDFVGVGWTRGPDGRPRAIEVLVFPAALRGTGEGERAWDLEPQSTMTNATVATAAGAPEGHVLKLTHKDGTTEINVPSSAPVWTLAAGDKSLVKAGLYVVLTGQKQADGSILAPSITIEKDGFKPPN
jgi:hypothetical protein